MDENHKRVLASDLLIIEERLLQIIEALQQTDEQTDVVLRSTVSDIDSGRRTRLLGTIRSMLDEIKQIKEQFGLEIASKSLRWHIIARLSEIWSILSDLKPEKIGRAFGQMSDDVQEVWRPHISKLSNMLDELYRELN